ncbi:MAG TPA: integration host factor subunit beta [Thermoanaerobaculia bacterium]|nr:integration host factor subunit beta [Thermoanaerobaculia bacterium]
MIRWSELLSAAGEPVADSGYFDQAGMTSGVTVSIKDGMTKAELVDEVARSTQLTKKHAEIIVNTVFDSIVISLKAGEKIELRGFGSFRIRQRGSRLGRNPKTGDQVAVPPKRIPYFKPGKELRDLLNGEG